MPAAHAEVLLSNEAAAAPLALSTPWRLVGDTSLDAATDSTESRRAYRGVQAVAPRNRGILAGCRIRIAGSTRSPTAQYQARATRRTFPFWVVA